jgi:hypothetical protein
MKLDKDLFLANINMVELEGKMVMVRPSQAESTNGKEVVIGEERQPRMIVMSSSLKRTVSYNQDHYELSLLMYQCIIHHIQE